MAFLDVSDIVTDPDFADRMTCERQSQTVGDDGIATNTAASSSFVGVVTSAKGDILERMASGERITGSILIHTRFALTDGKGAGQSADVVLWRGRRYTVVNVNDYSHFGRGFVCAECELIPLNG